MFPCWYISIKSTIVHSSGSFFLFCVCVNFSLSALKPPPPLPPPPSLCVPHYAWQSPIFHSNLRTQKAAASLRRALIKAVFYGGECSMTALCVHSRFNNAKISLSVCVRVRLCVCTFSKEIISAYESLISYIPLPFRVLGFLSQLRRQINPLLLKHTPSSANVNS